MLWVLSNHGLVLITIYTSTYPWNSTLPQSDSVTGLCMLCVYVYVVVRKCVCFASEVSVKKRECFMDLYLLFQRSVHLHQRCRAYLWNDLQLARTEREGNLCLNSLLPLSPSCFPPHFLPHQACFSQVLSSNTLPSPFSLVIVWSIRFFVSIFILPRRARGWSGLLLSSLLHSSWPGHETKSNNDSVLFVQLQSEKWVWKNEHDDVLIMAA